MSDMKNIFDNITNGINEELEIIDTTEDEDGVEIIDDNYLENSSNSDDDTVDSDIEELVEFEEFEVDVNLSGNLDNPFNTFKKSEADSTGYDDVKTNDKGIYKVEPEKDLVFEKDDISNYKEYYDDDVLEEDSEEEAEDFEEKTEDFEEEEEYSEDFEEEDFEDTDIEINEKLEDLVDFNIFEDKQNLKQNKHTPKAEVPKAEVPKAEVPKEKAENLNEKVIKKTANEEKYKNCIYEKGMDVVEFLRSNPQYREKEYASNFFSQEVLKETEKKGIINLKKGKYII